MDTLIAHSRSGYVDCECGDFIGPVEDWAVHVEMEWKRVQEKWKDEISQRPEPAEPVKPVKPSQIIVPPIPGKRI